MSAITNSPPKKPHFNPLFFLKNWLDGLDIQNPTIARSICTLIPDSCPFEQDITLFRHTLFHIPAFCKLNPFYNEFVGLRFRALCYLADVCGEDITPYICHS